MDMSLRLLAIDLEYLGAPRCDARHRATLVVATALRLPADNGDWALGVAQNGATDRPEQEAGEAPSAAAADDHQSRANAGFDQGSCGVQFVGRFTFDLHVRKLAGKAGDDVGQCITHVGSLAVRRAPQWLKAEFGGATTYYGRARVCAGHVQSRISGRSSPARRM
jgi:hypothetical protein